jgi:hypothetical protein
MEEELEGKLSTKSSTFRSSTDVEHHLRRMASSSAQNLSQFVPLPLWNASAVGSGWFGSRARQITSSTSA